MYSHVMPNNDFNLRQLAAWVPQWKIINPIEDEITALWQRLKTLRAAAAEARAALILSSPIELTDLEVRFWTKVIIVDDDDSCWSWTGSIRPVQGEEYGQFKWENPVTGKTESSGAHRVSFFLTNGCLPDHARHACDNPICVRPSHIINGTHADNMADRNRRFGFKSMPKGPESHKPHDQHGEANSIAVLTDEIVREARTLYAAGLSDREISERFGIDPATLGYAIRGETWDHITDPPAITERRSNGGKLTRTQIKEIKAARAAGESTVSLGERYGVTSSNISYLTRDKTVPPKERIRRNLTDRQVREIRAKRNAGVPLKDLVPEYGISMGMISHIAHGRAYAHVSP